MAEEIFPINIWINEERYEKLLQAGVADRCQEVLAGLKVIQVPTTAEEKDTILKKFPMAKYDTATTRTIELLPREVKDRLLDLVIEKKRINVMPDFLKELGE